MPDRYHADVYPPSATPAQADRVVLLHGIAAGPRSLRFLERAISVDGFETANLAIPSRRLPLDGLVADLFSRHETLFRQDSPRTHFVTYSMGGLVARALIALHRPPRLGRVVTIAPPHHGSEIADLLSGFGVYRRIFGPIGSQLTTDPPDSFRRLLGQVDYELGVIAGDRVIDPLSWLLLPKPNDGRVSVASTRLPGLTDHVTIHATHFAMMRNRTAIAQTLHFLRHGRFSGGQRCNLDAAPAIC